VAIWSALGSLAGAPVEQRTMTGLSVLLQSNALRQALERKEPVDVSEYGAS
jgi:type IV secretion system protein VirB4